MEPQTFTTPGPLSLDVRIPVGTIEVRATDTTQTQVALTGERDDQEVIVELTPRTLGGHRLLVAYKPRKTFGWFGGLEDLRCRIDVPLGTEIEGESGSADLTVVGEVGSLVFRSGSGDLSFGDVAGTTAVKVASGDVEGGTVGGDLTIHSASGDVRVASVVGATVVRTASGDTELGRVGGAVQAATASGDVQIERVETGRLNLKTVSGDVMVGVAPGTRVWLDLGSTSGDTVSELDGADGEAEGGASLEIHAASVSGDIVVRRATVGAA
ncbi:MAG: DUF4097 family beta strand repeat-containing protein [Actinomycetota bacterium]